MNNLMREILAALMEKHRDNPSTLSRKTSVGHESGVGQSTIFRFLKGEVSDLRPDTAKKIASVYGITESQLRGDQPIDDNNFEIETKVFKTDDPIKKAIIEKVMKIGTLDDLAYIDKTVEILNRMSQDSNSPENDNNKDRRDRRFNDRRQSNYWNRRR